MIETGNPGDGNLPGQLQAWYDRATELERSYRESEQYYGKKEFQVKIENSLSQKETEDVTLEEIEEDDNAMDVDIARITRPLPTCQSCGKIGHTTTNCQRKERIQSIMTQVRAMTIEEKNNLRIILGLQNN